MAKTDTSLIDDIISDIKQYSKDISKYSAIEVREELYVTAFNAIDYFYSEWEPEYYDRHEYKITKWIGYKPVTLTHNPQKAIKKFYHDNHEKVFTGGITLSPDYMDDIYRGEPELIFDLVYSGFHGLNAWEPESPRPSTPYHVTQPSTMDLIADKYNEIAKNPGSYVRKAVIKANAKTYSTF